MHESASTWRVAFFANEDRPEIVWLSVNEPKKVVALVLEIYPESVMDRQALLQESSEEKSGWIWKDKAARDSNSMPVGVYFVPYCGQHLPQARVSLTPARPIFSRLQSLSDTRPK